MNFLPMDRLGPHDRGSKIHFGALLPGISAVANLRLEARVIHEEDQFISVSENDAWRGFVQPEEVEREAVAKVVLGAIQQG